MDEILIKVDKKYVLKQFYTHFANFIWEELFHGKHAHTENYKTISPRF